jgi:hypothetical protein
MGIGILTGMERESSPKGRLGMEPSQSFRDRVNDAIRFAGVLAVCGHYPRKGVI